MNDSQLTTPSSGTIENIEKSVNNEQPWADLFDRVIVVSLATSGDRRRYIECHLPSVGINRFEFFDATSIEDPSVEIAYERGEVLTYPPCFRCGKLDCGNPNCNNFLIPPQVATFITYMRLWRYITNRDIQRTLILEDDVRIHDYYERVLTLLLKKISNGHVPFRSGHSCLIRLGWAHCADHTANKWLFNRFAIKNTIKMANPCHAITREFAASLLKRYTGIIHTVDFYQHKLAPEPGEAFTLFPPIASELSWTDGAFASTIHPKSVRSVYLRSQGDRQGAERNEYLVRKHINKKYFRTLLIIGHPRCGSGYSAHLCRQMKLDVGHEKLGADGISSWMFAVETDESPYALDAVARTRRALVWKYLIVPVRDLKTAAGSVMRDSTYTPSSYAFRRKHILRLLGLDLDRFETPLERAVRSVVSWYRIIMEQNPDLWFRVEDQHEKLQNFLIKKKLIPGREIVLDTSPINTDKSYRGSQYPKLEIPLADWEALSEESKLEISWYCTTFGYKAPFSSLYL